MKPQLATLVEQDVYDAFARLADSNERSVAAELRLAIKRHLLAQTEVGAAA